MLNTNYTEDLLGLKDIIITNIKELNYCKHIYLEIEKKPTKCPQCGTFTSKIHDYRMQPVKDIPAFGCNTILHIRKRRYVCPCCNKRFFETIDFLPKYQRTTNRLWAYVINLLRDVKSMKQIAKETNLSPTSVARILDHVNYSPIRLPSIVSIDEFRGNSGGEKFQCIVTNPKKRQILDVLPKRSQIELHNYFRSFENFRDVKLVVIDMSSLFRSVAKSALPNAEIIADKYHVVRQVTWAFENVRKEEQKRLSKAGRLRYKRSRGLLLKNPEKLTEEELNKVANILMYSERLATAYYLKNEFYKFMKSKDEYEAKQLLNQWIMHASVSGVEEFIKCTNTFVNWNKEILNAFKYQYTNGYTEGCNNKIKVIKRTGYGLRNFPRFRTRILHIAS